MHYTFATSIRRPSLFVFLTSVSNLWVAIESSIELTFAGHLNLLCHE